MTSSTIPTLTAETIQEWLIAQLAKQTGAAADEIDPKLPFDSYGLDSSQALQLIGEAEQLLNFRISLMLFWHYPTIESLSQRLAEEFAESDVEELEI